MCNKLPYEEFSGVEKKHKRLLKVKKMKLVQSYLIFKIKSQLLEPFSYLFSSNFPLLYPDPDPGGKINADPDTQPCYQLI